MTQEVQVILTLEVNVTQSKQEIENRAKQINKEFYTNQDIELIIFNESQL